MRRGIRSVAARRSVPVASIATPRCLLNAFVAFLGIPTSKALIFVYGQSDRIGAYPAGPAHSPGDMAATIFWALGLDPAAEIHDRLGRPFALADGKPITGIFA